MNLDELRARADGVRTGIVTLCGLTLSMTGDVLAGMALQANKHSSDARRALVFNTICLFSLLSCGLLFCLGSLGLVI
jgi:hypothetical protein